MKISELVQRYPTGVAHIKMRDGVVPKAALEMASLGFNVILVPQLSPMVKLRKLYAELVQEIDKLERLLKEE